MIERLGTFAILCSMIILGFGAPLASAHCDTLDGPVVTAARNALQSGDVTPVLKWVQKSTSLRCGLHLRARLRCAERVPSQRNLQTRISSKLLSGFTELGKGHPTPA